MADISKIKLPDGVTYNIKDATARGYVTGVKGNAESSYRTGNVNLTPANTGAVDKSGDTMTGDLKMQTVNGTVVPALSTSFYQSPIPKYLWHDVWAFCRATTPTYETSADGATSWTASTLEKNLFIHKEAWGSVDVLTPSIKGVRWTWVGGSFYASQSSWLVLGVTYRKPSAHFDVKLETSSDNGSSWTTIMSATDLFYSQTPIWIRNTAGTQDGLRLTLTWNNNSASNAKLGLCSVRLLTYRWGDQGKGSEWEYPYQWDTSFNILPIKNNESDLGSSSTKWKNVYATTFNGALSGNATTASAITNFESGNTAGRDCNTLAKNAITYFTSNGPSGFQDGALYEQYYSNNWIAQIAQRYTNGDLYVRAKSDGTWSDWSRLAKEKTVLPIRQSGSAYNPNVDGYVGSSGVNKYARIKLPENVYNVWQMLYIEVSIRGYYSVGMGGKVLINCYHSATSPYEWKQLSAVTVGKLPADLGVFGSDGRYIYVNLSEGLTTGLQYQTVSVDKILVGDNLRNYDISDISIDFVAELPTTHQTASVYKTFSQWNKPALSTDVTGTLPVANGGTGKTTANDASNYFLANSGSSSSATADVTDDMRIITSDSTGNENTWYKRTGIKFWNYIKGKIESSVLSTSTSSTSTTTAATSSAVKTAYDLANTANGTANTALSGVNGTLIYDHTYSISNGVATFTPHVYLKGQEVTTNYAKSCFVWKYKLASSVSGTPSYVTLTTNDNRGCTVTISTLGYGGYVLGEFTPA